jgi:eukaryotic-like serine/threonine-protein kinase
MSEREIFIAAAQIQSGQKRAAFIDQACGDNAELRRRITDLLAEQDKLGSYLEVPAGAVATIQHEPPAGERLGMHIGPYKLLQKLGEGGMGSVYLAEQQQPVKRHIALKIIKAGMDSAQVIARFEQERQALAIMDHPHIAKVLDAGTTDSGRPFFVMELVKGISITRYCDQEHLSPKERLELFIPVCHAVQHAHQKGIIHRDLKPSNVLIALYDGQPVPKVIDFGVAKATSQKLTERTLFTEVGSIVGTLEYMAPEQAELNNLDIDTRADIYSLGVLLYELLTGATPLSGHQLRSAGFNEMMRIIKEVEPQKPSTRLSGSAELSSIASNRKLEPNRLTRLVRGDLDWIVMKCLEKERSRRYETANAFALDIQRYLHDEPVLAGPPSTAYRLKKFLRRNKGPAVAAAVLLFTLLAGIIGTTWGLVRAEKSRLAEAEQRKLAESAERLARTNEQHATAERNRAVQAESYAKEERAKAVAEKQRADEEAAIAKAVNDFAQSDVLAQADLYAQDKHGIPGDRDIKLRTALDRASAKVSSRFANQPLVEAAVRLTVGKAYYSLGEYPAALPHLKRALEIRQEQMGANHPDTLASTYALAMLLTADDQFALAEPLLVQVMAARRKDLGNEHPDTLTAIWGLFELYAKSGKLVQNEGLIFEVLEGRRKVLGDEHPDTLNTQTCVAMLYARKGDLVQAEQLLLKVLEGLRRVLGSEHPDTLLAAGSLGWVYMAQKRSTDAELILVKTLEEKRKALGPLHQLTLSTLINLGVTYANLEKFDQAERSFLECLEGSRKMLGADNLVTLDALGHLSRLYERRGQDRLAEPCFIELLDINRRKFGPNHSAVAAASARLAGNLLRQKKYMQAEPLLVDSLATFEQKAPTSWLRFYSQSLMGDVRFHQQQFAEAEPLLVQGYEGMKQREASLQPRDKPRIDESIQRLIDLYIAWEKPVEVDKWSKTLADRQGTSPPHAAASENP